MKKNSLPQIFMWFFVLIQLVVAQAPPPDLTGEALKQWLRDSTYTNKIHPLTYSTARMYMYNFIDNHNDTITDVYGGYKRYLPYGGTETNPTPINCEHTVPQSFFNYAEPMKSDMHHLFPVYSSWNSTRSNNPFAEIPDDQTTKWMYQDQSQSTIPTSNIDAYSEYANGKFEPREDHKGNVARAIFYFYTMYPTQAGSITQVADPTTLYQWHLMDPVDSMEIARNNLIEQYQGNRNPYIDYPELVARAWGFSSNQNPPVAPANLTLSSTSSTLILSWNDVANEEVYHVYKSTDGSNYTMLTSLPANSTNYTDAAVTTGTTYFYYVTASNAAGESNPSNTVSGQTGTTSVVATDLFISEYVEGSSYNKAIEIANFTGQDVDLSNYSLSKQTNGSGSWITHLSLTGILPDGATFVIVNQSAGTTLLSKANLATGNQVMTFNGNDPVGLFKNGQLIDIIGDYNSGGTYFAQDVTLRRNSDVISPSTTYNQSEWTTYPKDDFSDIGTHTFGSTGGSTPLAFVNSPSATNVTTTTADISFSSNQNCNAIVYYGTTTPLTSSVTATGTNFTVTLTNLQPNTSYIYQVELSTASETIISSQSGFTTLLPVPAAPTNLTASLNGNNVVLTWNDVLYESSYKVYRSVDNVQFTQIASVSANTTTYTDANVTAGNTYYYYVIASNSSGNSAPGNTVSVTIPSAQLAADLFFTEYVEGSRNNKALEIGNFTGQSVNLSEYSLKISFNGSGSWDGELFLSGTLLHQDVLVLVNSNAKKSLKKKADITSSNSVLLFNGNDAIGLFHNGVLIDIIGNLGSASYYATDKTLRRNPDIHQPTTQFSMSEWTTYGKDDFSGLGTHTTTYFMFADKFGNQTNELTEYKLNGNYPNPFNPSTTIYFDLPANTSGELVIFNIHGQLIKSYRIVSGLHSVTWDATDQSGNAVPTGIYLYRIVSENGISQTRKMIYIK